MRGLLSGKQTESTTTSFLPEDYLERKAERRANLVCLTLFFIVVFCVVGAFFVTNQQWSSVKTEQEMINIRYTQAAQEIEQLKELEQQKEQMLQKAALVTALIERVPRSVLLAELINRMPERLTLLSTELESERVKNQPSRRAKKEAGGRRVRGRSLADRGEGEEESEEPAPAPPRFETRLGLVGVAKSHQEVAWYVAALQDCTLLQNVELIYSETTIIKDRGLNKFRVEAMLRPDADGRKLDALTEPPIKAFGDDAENAPEPGVTASVDEEEN